METEKPITSDPISAASSNNQQSLKFSQHHAFIVGIDHYEKVSQLTTAVNDAKKIAEVLQEKHSFQVQPPLLDAKHSSLHTLLYQTMPDIVKSDDRVVFYFAGHGIAIDGDDGPAGYLAPADADPADLKTFIAMKDLREILNSLPCRHLLIVMDCCFSGAFKWTSGTRHIGSLLPKKIYKERFDRFVHDPAWQVITSAGYDQLAMDVIQDKPTGDRGLVATESGVAHSPFALALFQALAGEADTRIREEGDGLITATELYSYIRDKVEPATIEIGQKSRQTPGFFPLSKHDKGEFIFLHPKHRLNLPPRPLRSPYKGLNPYDESDASLFYGRFHVIKELKTQLNNNRLLVVTGASGTGKSSILKAGLIPWLREKGFQMIEMNPGNHPLIALEQSVIGIDESNPQKSVLLIDQFEETITICQDKIERETFLLKLNQDIENSSHIYHVIIIIRSDFQEQFRNSIIGDHWQKGLYTIPAFSLEDLKEAAFMPTVQEVMIFDPPELLDTIVGDVMQAPGAISLMSYTLDELYLAYIASGRQDRALHQSDYKKFGGLAGLLHKKADSLYLSLDPGQQVILKKMFLRMVSVQGELESRRVKIKDLNYSPTENLLVEEVIKKLVESRLIVKDTDYIEAAHPALISSWKTLLDWIHKAGKDMLILIDRLGPQADQYAMLGNRKLLWNKNPNLDIAASLLKQPEHGLNAHEIKFVRKSMAHNQNINRTIWTITIATILALSGLSVWAFHEKDIAESQRKIAQQERETAQKEKDRAILSLFEGLSLNMSKGNPGSLCLNGFCEGAPMGDSMAVWQSLGKLPEGALIYDENISSIDFAGARQYGNGHVLAYAHDGLTRDVEMTDDGDNMLFAQNAFAWLTPLEFQENCPSEIVILVWEGTYANISNMIYVQEFIKRRGWKIKLTSPETLEQDLSCGSVLWYLSDWNPPSDFAQKHVPLIMNFVQEGGGLLIGGLGWSYHQLYQGTDTVYSGDILGKPLGLSFTQDAFKLNTNDPIKLLPGY